MKRTQGVHWLAADRSLLDIGSKSPEAIARAPRFARFIGRLWKRASAITLDNPSRIRSSDDANSFACRRSLAAPERQGFANNREKAGGLEFEHGVAEIRSRPLLVHRCRFDRAGIGTRQNYLRDSRHRQAAIQSARTEPVMRSPRQCRALLFERGPKRAIRPRRHAPCRCFGLSDRRRESRVRHASPRHRPSSEPGQAGG